MKKKGYVSSCKTKVNKKNSCGHSHLINCGLPLEYYIKSIGGLCDKECGV